MSHKHHTFLRYSANRNLAIFKRPKTNNLQNTIGYWSWIVFNSIPKQNKKISKYHYVYLQFSTHFSTIMCIAIRFVHCHILKYKTNKEKNHKQNWQNYISSEQSSKIQTCAILSKCNPYLIVTQTCYNVKHPYYLKKFKIRVDGWTF